LPNGGAQTAKVKAKSMFRLLKFLPVIIPVVTKFVKSPQGQRAIAKARKSLDARKGGTTHPKR
jgi:hypothetical protein